ncbi:MAG: hypothetical protein ACTHZ9_08560 [Leucobacter sp.]
MRDDAALEAVPDGTLLTVTVIVDAKFPVSAATLIPVVGQISREVDDLAEDQGVYCPRTIFIIEEPHTDDD